MGIQDPLHTMFRVRKYVGGVRQACCSLEVIVKRSLDRCQYE